MEQTICAICAWRATCQKKFSMSGKSTRCADYVKDLSIKEETREEQGPERPEQKKKQ